MNSLAHGTQYLIRLVTFTRPLPEKFTEPGQIQINTTDKSFNTQYLLKMHIHILQDEQINGS